MTVAMSVLVPSYRRPDSLERCLRALAAQTRPPDEVVVGVRADDRITLDMVRGWSADFALLAATTAAPGVVAAMQAALDTARGDIIALTDDDTRPRPDWIAGLLSHFAADARVAGVGGRDWQPYERGKAARVGVVQWYGRVIGNHHLGSGPPREVDVLKGANCAYRAAVLRAVGFDTRLRGMGAQLHWELGVCLPIRRAGWRLIYDPAVAVDHDVAPRHEGDALHRGVFTAPPLVDAVHNETAALLEGRAALWRAMYRAWAFAIGTGEAPGVAQFARNLLRGDRQAVVRWRAARAGRRAGAVTARTQPRRLTVPEPPST